MFVQKEGYTHIKMSNPQAVLGTHPIFDFLDKNIWDLLGMLSQSKETPTMEKSIAVVRKNL